MAIPFHGFSARYRVSYSFEDAGAPLDGLTTPVRHELPGREALQVWAIPISFATTPGISFDLFSSGYLDVSVPPLALLPIQEGLSDSTPDKVSPFGYPRLCPLDGSSRLNAALPRPSSALGPKASPVSP